MATYYRRHDQSHNAHNWGSVDQRRAEPLQTLVAETPRERALTIVVPWSYHRCMSTVVKRSISLPSEVFAALENEAAAQGQTVSAALADAADQWLATRRGLRSVRAWERENGALTAAELAAADAELDGAGVARR
jgi:hypothetical protein